jgi:hypothetical protein
MNISVGSDACIDGMCSAPIPTSSQICSVGVVATNEFGSSNAITRQTGQFGRLCACLNTARREL